MSQDAKLFFVEPSVDHFSIKLQAVAEEIRSRHGRLRIFVVGAPDCSFVERFYAIEANNYKNEIKQVNILDIDEVTDNSIVVLCDVDEPALRGALERCINCGPAAVIAPLTSSHYSNNPLFLVSVPKAGTHLLYNLAAALGFNEGVEAPDFPEGQTWYCLEHTNSHTSPRDFFVDTVRRSRFGNRHHPFTYSPVVFIYRHPLDILVSEAEYYHLPGKTSFSQFYIDKSFEERVYNLLSEDQPIGSFASRVKPFASWMEFPNVISVSYEELVGSAGGGNDLLQQRSIWSLMLRLQIDGSVARVRELLGARKSPTFREGRIGPWRERFIGKFGEQVKEVCAEVVEAFGYSVDSSSVFSKFVEKNRCRNFLLQPNYYRDLPLLVESNFLGCNLVRYKQRFIGIPLRAGSVDYEKFEFSDLLRLPNAASLVELKILLCLGAYATKKRTEELESIFHGLSNGIVPPNFWSIESSPVIVKEINGFNVVAFEGLFVGVRQSLGPVNFSEGVDMLAATFHPDDVIIGHSISSVSEQISGISASSRYAKRLSFDLHESIRRLNLNFAGKYEEFSQRVSEGSARVDGLLERQEAIASELEKSVLESRQGMDRLAQQLAALEAATNQNVSQYVLALQGELREIRRIQVGSLERLSVRLDYLENTAYRKLMRWLSRLRLK